MLELSNYYIPNIENLTDLITNIFVIIDDIYNEIIPLEIKNRRNIGDSKLSDSEIITLSITQEILSIDSEKSFFSLIKREYKDLFPNLGHRTRFNRTKRNLRTVIEAIRMHISKIFSRYSEKIRLIDSMPIPICKLVRANKNKSFKDIASFGVCSSKQEKYYGFKLHALTTKEGFITDFVVTPANVHDKNVVWDLCENHKSITIIGDKGYTGQNLVKELREFKNIELLHFKRKNDKDQYQKEFSKLLVKSRRKIETTFSQLVEQFNLNKVKSKSIEGFKTRTTIKILGHNILFLLNKLMGREDSVSKIKELVFG